MADRAGTPGGEKRMKELNIEEIHEITLDILKKIDEIVTEQGMKYYLAYGSLIGAVRHRGFIPWDDDLDIMMVRPDYEKLIQYFIENAKMLYPLKVFTYDTCENYPHMIARICDMRYPIVVENEIDCGMGVFVDVYPLDGMGSDEKTWNRVMRRRQQLIAASYYATRIHFEIPKKKYRIVDKYLLYLYAKSRGREYFLKKIEAYKDYFPWETSRYVGCAVWGKELFDKKYFLDTMRMPFEDMQVMVPAGYDGLLKCSYGDYMQLPPEEERQPQHNYAAYRE